MTNKEINNYQPYYISLAQLKQNNIIIIIINTISHITTTTANNNNIESILLSCLLCLCMIIKTNQTLSAVS